LCAVELLAMKWPNMTDFKWKSGNLVYHALTTGQRGGRYDP